MEPIICPKGISFVMLFRPIYKIVSVVLNKINTMKLGRYEYMMSFVLWIQNLMKIFVTAVLNAENNTVW